MSNGELLYAEHYFSSAERTYGTNDQPIWILDKALPNVKRIKYVKAIIPKSYYSVTAISDTLYLQENLGAAFSVSIPNGNYLLGATDLGVTIAIGTLQASFLGRLETDLTAASPNGRTYTCSYNNVSGLITITVSAGTFEILGSNSISTLHKLIGFQSVDTGQAAFHVATGVQRVESYPEYLFVRGNIGNTNYPSTIDNSNTANNIISRIPTDSNQGLGGVISNTNSETFQDNFVSEQSIDKIELYCTHVQLNSNEQQIMQFFESPWSIVMGYYYSPN